MRSFKRRSLPKTTATFSEANHSIESRTAVSAGLPSSTLSMATRKMETFLIRALDAVTGLWSDAYRLTTVPLKIKTATAVSKGVGGSVIATDRSCGQLGDMQNRRRIASGWRDGARRSCDLFSVRRRELAESEISVWLKTNVPTKTKERKQLLILYAALVSDKVSRAEYKWPLIPLRHSGAVVAVTRQVRYESFHNLLPCQYSYENKHT